MDELLHEPQNLVEAKLGHETATDTLNDLGKTLSGWKEKLGAFWRETAAPAAYKLVQFGREHPISPMMFLAVAASIGFGATVATLYDSSYVVSVDGVTLGAIHETAEFERAVESVETRATRILGYDYAVESEITYERALTKRDGFTASGELETYLFNQIGEIVMGYDLVVDGVVLGSADNKADLEALLETIAAPYMTENTVDYSFEKTVLIRSAYITSDSNMDLDTVYATLTENTTGETTYTVVKGDTYSEIAYDNDMSLDELMALNPEASLDSLMIGDVLNVKQIIPYLSVRTVENVTYNAAVACPIEYVDDNTIYEGNTKVITQGVEGEAIVNANVTYVNGYETERTILTSETISEPTTTVIARGTAPRPKTASTGTYRWPCSGNITSYYGYRTIFGSYSFHSGLDIANSYGTNIVAADGGKVTFAGWSGNYGYLVIITHDNGDQTYYAHCSSLLVSAGQRVYKGEHIAEMGSTGRSTGNHCHFEIRINGSTVNPLNYL